MYPDPLAVAEPAQEVEDDATLIEQSGDDASIFAAIFDRHASAVHRYLARRALYGKMRC